MKDMVTSVDLHQWGFYAEVLALVALSFLVGSLLARGLVRVAVRRTDAPGAPGPDQPGAAATEGGVR